MARTGRNMRVVVDGGIEYEQQTAVRPNADYFRDDYASASRPLPERTPTRPAHRRNLSVPHALLTPSSPSSLAPGPWHSRLESPLPDPFRSNSFTDAGEESPSWNRTSESALQGGSGGGMGVMNSPTRQHPQWMSEKNKPPKLKSPSIPPSTGFQSQLDPRPSARTPKHPSADNMLGYASGEASYQAGGFSTSEYSTPRWQSSQEVAESPRNPAFQAPSLSPGRGLPAMPGGGAGVGQGGQYTWGQPIAPRLRQEGGGGGAGGRSRSGDAADVSNQRQQQQQFWEQFDEMVTRVRCKDEELLSGILEQTAGPLLTQLLSTLDPESGLSLLHEAVLYENEEGLQQLLDVGADINGAPCTQSTPLIEAARIGHFKMLKVLLSRGADINAVDDMGWTALHHACQEGHRSIVKVLLFTGADVNIRDGNGRTARDLVSNSNDKISSLFRASSQRAPAAGGVGERGGGLEDASPPVSPSTELPPRPGGNYQGGWRANEQVSPDGAPLPSERWAKMLTGKQHGSVSSDGSTDSVLELPGPSGSFLDGPSSARSEEVKELGAVARQHELDRRRSDEDANRAQQLYQGWQGEQDRRGGRGSTPNRLGEGPGGEREDERFRSQDERRGDAGGGRVGGGQGGDRGWRNDEQGGRGGGDDAGYSWRLSGKPGLGPSGSDRSLSDDSSRELPAGDWRISSVPSAGGSSLYTRGTVGSRSATPSVTEGGGYMGEADPLQRHERRYSAQGDVEGAVHPRPGAVALSPRRPYSLNRNPVPASPAGAPPSTDAPRPFPIGRSTAAAGGPRAQSSGGGGAWALGIGPRTARMLEEPTNGDYGVDRMRRSISMGTPSDYRRDDEEDDSDEAPHSPPLPRAANSVPHSRDGQSRGRGYRSRPVEMQPPLALQTGEEQQAASQQQASRPRSSWLPDPPLQPVFVSRKLRADSDNWGKLGAEEGVGAGWRASQSGGLGASDGQFADNSRTEGERRGGLRPSIAAPPSGEVPARPWLVGAAQRRRGVSGGSAWSLTSNNDEAGTHPLAPTAGPPAVPPGEPIAVSRRPVLSRSVSVAITGSGGMGGASERGAPRFLEERDAGRASQARTGEDRLLRTGAASSGVLRPNSQSPWQWDAGRPSPGGRSGPMLPVTSFSGPLLQPSPPLTGPVGPERPVSSAVVASIHRSLLSPRVAGGRPVNLGGATGAAGGGLGTGGNNSGGGIGLLGRPQRTGSPPRITAVSGVSGNDGSGTPSGKGSQQQQELLRTPPSPAPLPAAGGVPRGGRAPPAPTPKSDASRAATTEKGIVGKERRVRWDLPVKDEVKEDLKDDNLTAANPPPVANEDLNLIRADWRDAAAANACVACSRTDCDGKCTETEEKKPPVLLTGKKDLFENAETKTTGTLKWTRGELLGEGAYGKVFAGLNQTTGEIMAVKQLKLAEGDDKSQHMQALEREISLYRKMRHKHIVGYIDMERDVTSGSLYVFLEFVSGGSIHSMLERFGKFSEPLVRIYTRQLLLGLRYLHEKHIVHRDIKGGNVLVDGDGVIKLADFGASKAFHDTTGTDACKSIRGSVFWMAPEVIQGDGYGRRADVWSVGCTVIEMLTGSHPWPGMDNTWSAIFHIAKTTTGPPLPEDCSPEGKDFLLQCFQLPAKNRPSAQELLEHPFVCVPDTPKEARLLGML
eukprot:TRINITY_DN13955_c0_g1_i1.p1 TRINITY_DN13955_c0_g1~~TRINITY_DN13955_c0_g1_i1.p1  ORF type:complete len:1657 (-),score=354.72 TRINITY_DN13955_c0_g1_i1:709-5679(-)